MAAASDGVRNNVIYIFDICDTLFKENTTIGFAEWLGYNQKRVGFLVRLRNYLEYKILGRDYVLLEALNYIDDMLPKTKKYKIEKYVDYLLSTKKLEALDYLLNIQQLRGEIILCSASSDYVVQIIAERLGVEGFGSQYSEKKSLKSIQVESLKGRKHEKIAQRVIGKEIYFVSDNLSDYKMMRLAKYRVPVYRGFVHKIQWKLRLCCA